MISKYKFAIALAALAVAVSWSVTPAFTAGHRSEISTSRAQLMKGMGGGMKGVKTATDAGAALSAAKKINANSMKLEGMWKKGSGGPKSRAKDEIWQNMADFKSKLKSLQNASKALVAAAEGGNLDAAKAAMGGVGKVCGSCHKAFRGPKI